MPEVFRTQRFVEFSDTDMAGIAHFSAFFRYMESAEHALLRSLGLSVFQSHGDDLAISFPRVNAECDYASPVRCEDVLDIEVAITRLGGKSITYRFEMTCGGVEVATGAMTSVCCRIEPGKPPVAVPLPDEIAEKLRPFVAG
ncbi:1,4-dihydroxy-2-naphthoyl-CoA hydrolase [Posidoniimonas polymericola]|uniref:1,4-dihydroxy-2-naphthoyl-CoA hydrolase n=1 Tax=Posidoniimonas polymericola TaxID=2528002 RepID=A0A5C5ZE41_9BACT|nr:thioesterase family protein [Posidoniimonas polymericola]TWT85689.1 1,4-dihydroxy-2-naphthoyl-CoA hydrolase [Posidoniimonas polymericola]